MTLLVSGWLFDSVTSSYTKEEVKVVKKDRFHEAFIKVGEKEVRVAKREVKSPKELNALFSEIETYMEIFDGSGSYQNRGGKRQGRPSLQVA